MVKLKLLINSTVGSKGGRTTVFTISFDTESDISFNFISVTRELIGNILRFRTLPVSVSSYSCTTDEDLPIIGNGVVTRLEPIILIILLIILFIVPVNCPIILAK